MRKPIFAILVVASTSLTSCELLDPNNKPTTQELNNISAVGHIYHSENGNRLVAGNSDITQITPINIPLPHQATWIAALKTGNESIWATVLNEGTVKAYKVNSETYSEIAITPNRLNTTIPPTLVIDNEGNAKLGNIFDNASDKSAAIILDKQSGKRAYIADNGDLVINDKGNEQRLKVNALLHARLLVDEQQRILVLTEPNTDYGHTAVLGDSFPHAKSITLIDTQPTLQIASKITLETNDVIEGNALIWEDLNNDQQREIITTVSNDETGTQGGRIVIFNEDNSIYGESNPIGTHYRWRHQIAVAPFKSQDQLHLASLYVPHIEPNIEFFRVDNESMTRENLAIPYTSHLSTSPNIDISLAGDFDNDGRIEVLLINRYTRSQIAAYELNETGPEFDWTLEMQDSVSSNSAAVTLDNNAIAYGIGQGESLLIWHP